MECVTILETIQAQRERNRETFAEACVYAGQAVIATLVVLAAYRWAGKPGGMWAAVSAVLVSSPGFNVRWRPPPFGSSRTCWASASARSSAR